MSPVTPDKISSRVVDGVVRILVDGKLVGTVTVDEIDTGDEDARRFELVGRGVTFQGAAPYVTAPERASSFFASRAEDVTR